MLVLLVVALLAVPIVELWIIVEVARGIGVLETIALLFAISIFGAWLLRQQGMAAWRRVQDALNRGEVPAQEVVDGALIVVGGALLLTPGFLSDAVGLLFLLPPTRAGLKAVARRVMSRWARQRRVYTARVVRVDRHDPAASRPPEALSSESPPRRADDSPDTG